jgi:FAD:protein FMN transferase
MPDLIELSRSFKAMNTRMKAEVCLPESQSWEGEESLNAVEKLFDVVELKLSRFRKNSDLSILNKAAGKKLQVAPLLFEAVSIAIESARLTKGIFDPTVLYYLISAGYDRSFEIVKQTSDSPDRPEAFQKTDWREISLDPLSRSIQMPEGCGLDLGGIGKGLAVDKASGLLEKYQNYAIDAGGDIRVGGSRADGHLWTIGVASPSNESQDVFRLVLTKGSVCTSSTVKRTWISRGIHQHHIIDPRSGKPSASGVISCTIIAEKAVLSETLSKAVLIMGTCEGVRFLENQPEVQGILITKEGEILTTSNFKNKAVRTRRK